MTTQIITNHLLLQIGAVLGPATIAFTVRFLLNQYPHQQVAPEPIPVKVHEDF